MITWLGLVGYVHRLSWEVTSRGVRGRLAERRQGRRVSNRPGREGGAVWLYCVEIVRGFPDEASERIPWLLYAYS